MRIWTSFIRYNSSSSRLRSENAYHVRLAEICEDSFRNCKSLSCVTFGESSSLKLIGKWAFSQSGVREIHIPDGVEKLCHGCLSGCKNLSRVTFGESSSLNLIGNEVFHKTGVREIHFANGVMKRFLQAPCLAIGGSLRHDQVGNEIT